MTAALGARPATAWHVSEDEADFVRQQMPPTSMSNPSRETIPRRTCYESVHQCAQQNKLVDGKSWNSNDRDAACRRIEHPITGH
jgi:hypothetical protein